MGGISTNKIQKNREKFTSFYSVYFCYVLLFLAALVPTVSERKGSSVQQVPREERGRALFLLTYAWFLLMH